MKIKLKSYFFRKQRETTLIFKESYREVKWLFEKLTVIHLLERGDRKYMKNILK